MGNPVGSAGLRRRGFVLAVEDGLALLDPGWQRLDQVAASSTPGPSARFNEGTCDPAGRFLAGTMAYDQAPGAAPVYRLDSGMCPRAARSAVRRLMVPIGRRSADGNR